MLSRRCVYTSSSAQHHFTNLVGKAKPCQPGYLLGDVGGVLASNTRVPGFEFPARTVSLGTMMLEIGTLGRQLWCLYMCGTVVAIWTWTVDYLKGVVKETEDSQCWHNNCLVVRTLIMLTAVFQGRTLIWQGGGGNLAEWRWADSVCVLVLSTKLSFLGCQ